MKNCAKNSVHGAHNTVLKQALIKITITKKTCIVMQQGLSENRTPAGV